MADEQTGTVYAEGQPFPLDPLTGISPNSTLGQAASASIAQQPAFIKSGQEALEALKKMQNPMIPGGGMVPGAQLPTPVMPQPPIQGSQVGIAQGPFGSVGERKRADKQSLYGSIGSLVNQVVDRQYKMKVQNIQRDLEVLGGAIQGYKEGQASGNKEMMDHNAAIINNMLHDDPKKAKELSKVFDVNLNPLAPQKGKKNQANEYTDAGKAYLAQAQQARKNYPGLNPSAAMFMQRMPQTMQMDPSLATRAAMVKAGLIPNANTTTNAMAKIADSIISGQSRMDVATQNKAASMIMRSATMGLARMLMVGRLAGEDAKQLANHQYRMQELQYKHQLAMSDPNPQHQAAALKDLGKNIDDTIGVVKYDTDGKTIREATGLRGQIAHNNEEIEKLRGQIHFYTDAKTATDIQGKINAFQQYNNQLETNIRALQTTRTAIGAAGAGLTQGGGSNVPAGAAGNESPDSTGADEGDEGGGEPDSDSDEGLNDLERFFGTPAGALNPETTP